MAKKRKTPTWYAIKVGAPTTGHFTVRNTTNPRIKDGRFAFGPYRTRAEACRVGGYQDYGRVPEGCGSSRQGKRRSV
jgi:hypothetical protein